MSRAQHPSSRELHAEHEERRAMVRALQRQERHAAERMLLRALRTIHQPHEPHQYRTPDSVEWSPPPDDLLTAPGGVDHTGFCPGGVC